MKLDDLPNVDETVNDLLARWHRWSRGYTFGKGYPTADIACRQSRKFSKKVASEFIEWLHAWGAENGIEYSDAWQVDPETGEIA